MTKGKRVINFSSSLQANVHEVTHTPRWEAPQADHAKLNIDGSFLKEDGTAGAAMLLRDHEGAVIFAATRVLFNCGEPLEAEMAAMEEGLRLPFPQKKKIYLAKTESLIGDTYDFGLDNLPCLIYVECRVSGNASAQGGVEAAKAAMERAAMANPNHPKLLFVNRSLPAKFHNGC